VEVMITEVDSPIGRISLVLRGEEVCALHFSDRFARHRTALEKRLGEPQRSWRVAPHSTAAARRLREYLAGDLDALDALAIDTGGTPFQRSVWAAVRRVRAGETASYGQIACAIDAPAAVRAVGAANGANPVCLIVPCHRIVGADGSLTGYGGGIERKLWLLEHESPRSAQLTLGAQPARPAQPGLRARTAVAG
jgi:methylated-DNA-[protein]-cysteine S-methyltransferase